jgi:hypothetical protein
VKSPQSILVNLSLFLGSVILASGSTEMWLRFSHYGEAGQIRLTGFMQYDPLLGWRHIPNVTNEWSTPEYRVSVHYNAKGWRDSDHTYAKPPNTSRIVIVGDSFAEGLGVAAQDRFSDIAQAIVGRPFEVVNLGVAAYSTDQKLLLLENDGWKYEPDIVVLELDFYDVWGDGLPSTHMVMGTQKPVFVLDGSGALKLTNVPVPSPPARTARPRSRLYDLLRRTMARQEQVWRPSAGPPETLSDQYTTYRKTESPQLKNAWLVTQALLHRMKQETEQHHARLLILYVPSRVELSEEEWHRWPFSSDDEPGHVAAKIKAMCRAEGIDYIEPSERFKEAGRRKRLYYAADLHWNVEGHRLAGKILAEYIQNSSPRTAKQ